MVLLLACSSDPATPVAEEEAFVPSEHTWTGEGLAPSLDAEGVQAALDVGWPKLVAASPYAIYDAYSLAMAERDGSCPFLYESAGLEHWDGHCSTPSGWGFDGRSSARHAERWEVDGVVYDEYGAFNQSDGVVTSPEGARMSFAGYGELMDRTEDGVRQVYSWLMGTWGWDEGEGGGAWLTEGWSVAMIVEYTDAAGSWLRIDGGASGVDAPEDTITADDLVMDSSSGCDAEPTGAVLVRTEDGGRYEVDFGDAACDGCGTVSFGGTELGEVCLDFSAMQDLPW